jgi:sensor histidine kinase YesM
MRKIAQLKFRVVQANFIPHFTGNVLNSISGLISKDVDLSRKYIARFSDFSKLTLRNSDKLWQPISEELDYALLYLELEKLRFQEKLNYSVSVAPEVDTQKMMPTMILQTFCENAIKHGLRPKPEGGKIEIRVYQEADYTVLAVEDCGIGREKAQIIKTEGTKQGLKIIGQQLDIFNKNKTKKAYLEIHDLFDETGQSCGTRFKLYIPLSSI